MPESLIPNWLVRPLAVLSAATVNSSGGLPVVVSDVNTTQTVVTPSAGSADNDVPKLRLGINVDPAFYWVPNRIFMDLTMGARWDQTGGPNGATPFRPDQLDENGNLISLDPGTKGSTLLNFPMQLFRGETVDVICRWKGDGAIQVNSNGAAVNVRYGTRNTTFTMTSKDGPRVQLYLTRTNASDPIRDIDCRERDADPNTFFYPEYVEGLRGFDTLRFLDWTVYADNLPVTWATRSKPQGLVKFGYEGYPLEYMIELSNKVHANMWVNLPWNTDAEYYRKYAEMVRDTLDPDLKVYVETSNEVWNGIYKINAQAADEGMAENLADNRTEAMLRRYAEKITEVNKIWTEVFAGQEDRLVRIAAIQNGSQHSTLNIMNFRDTADYVDAIAVAPYFYLSQGIGPYKDDPASMQALFDELDASIDTIIQKDVALKKLVKETYGKRLVTYESGQHVTGSNVAFMQKIQRDPRMGKAYTRYLTAWQQNIGDLMNHYKDVYPINQYGAFGLREYGGQPLTESPKAKAFYLFKRSLGQ